MRYIFDNRVRKIFLNWQNFHFIPRCNSFEGKSTSQQNNSILLGIQYLSTTYEVFNIHFLENDSPMKTISSELSDQTDFNLSIVIALFKILSPLTLSQTLLLCKYFSWEKMEEVRAIHIHVFNDIFTGYQKYYAIKEEGILQKNNI